MNTPGGNIETGTVAADNLALTAGTTVNTGILTLSGTYSVTAQDFLGSSLAPAFDNSDNDFTIVDTAGGLSAGALVAPGNLSVTVQNGGLLALSAAASAANVTLASMTGSIALNGAVTTAGMLTLMPAAPSRRPPH